MTFLINLTALACILGSVSVRSIGIPISGRAANEHGRKLGSDCPMARLQAELAELPEGIAQHRELEADGSGQDRELQTICAGQKKTIDPAAIYGDVRTAKTCALKAVDLLKRNWDKDFNGPCLRAAFHDAGTYSALPESGFGKPAQCGGVNGSFKKEFEAGALDGFKSFPQQNGMQLCYNFLWGSNGDSGLSKQIRAIPECTKMTNADLIQIAGYVAVVKGGGASCSFYPGRPDSNGYDNTDELPSEALTATGLINKFDSYDFSSAYGKFSFDTKKTVIILSGAHTMGKARVSPLSPDSFGLNTLSSTPDQFDGEYYTEVVTPGGYKGRFGWFASDMHGRCNQLVNKNGQPATTENLDKLQCNANDSPFYEQYKAYSDAYLAGQDGGFKNDFCKAYRAMGTIGLIAPAEYFDDAAGVIISA